MKRVFILLLIIISCAATGLAQASGNVGYAQNGGSSRAEQNERSKRVQSKEEMPPDASSFFIEASVLMNVKADEHVAVFGLAQECVTVPECHQKMDATIEAFSAELKKLGISTNDFFVDFAAQNKIYGYRLNGTVAKENLVGFELKKNIAVHYKDKQLLDKLIIAASRSNIFDLIKVDYIVTDTASIQNRLREEAMKIVVQKVEKYQAHYAFRILPPAQIYAEKPSIYYPTEMYDSYTAYESDEVNPYDNDRYVLQTARKSRTFFFNPLNADGFDEVINPLIIEPVVQFTLYLKVRFVMDQPKK